MKLSKINFNEIKVIDLISVNYAKMYETYNYLEQLKHKKEGVLILAENLNFKKGQDKYLAVAMDTNNDKENVFYHVGSFPTLQGLKKFGSENKITMSASIVKSGLNIPKKSSIKKQIKMEFIKPTKAQLTRHLNKLSNDKLGNDYAYIMSADLDRSIYWANDKEFRSMIIERLANQILIHWNSKNLETNLTEIGYLKKSSIKNQSNMNPLFKFYNEELNGKKTISSKKAFLTKAENQTKEHLKDLEEHKAGGWLYGEKVSNIRIAKVKAELKVIQELKEKLNVGLKKPVTKGLTTLCAKTVGTTGRRKSNGSVKKGYVAKKGGKVVAVKKKIAVKK